MDAEALAMVAQALTGSRARNFIGATKDAAA
jgi:hypothetical protein